MIETRFKIGKFYFIHTSTYFFYGRIAACEEMYIRFDEGYLVHPKGNLVSSIRNLNESVFSPINDLTLGIFAIIAAFQWDREAIEPIKLKVVTDDQTDSIQTPLNPAGISAQIDASDNCTGNGDSVRQDDSRRIVANAANAPKRKR